MLDYPLTIRFCQEAGETIKWNKAQFPVSVPCPVLFSAGDPTASNTVPVELQPVWLSS